MQELDKMEEFLSFHRETRLMDYRSQGKKKLQDPCLGKGLICLFSRQGILIQRE